MKYLIPTILFSLLLNVSCKKEEVVIPKQTKSKPAENYFSFLKDGNEFTYKKYFITNRYQEDQSDTTSVVTYKVKVSKPDNDENYYELDNIFPLININRYYSNSTMFGTSPTDSIVSKYSKMRERYVLGFNNTHSGLPDNIGNVYIKQVIYKNDSIDVYNLSYADGSDPSHSGEIILSKDFGVISAKYVVDPYMPPISQIEAYELISTNF